jgi:predicted nuclease with TOPRIM domain
MRWCHDDIVYMFFYSELIKKYNKKCKENENLRKQQKELNTLVKEYHSKLVNCVTKQTPLEEVRNIHATSSVNMDRNNCLLLDSL